MTHGIYFIPCYNNLMEDDLNPITYFVSLGVRDEVFLQVYHYGRQIFYDYLSLASASELASNLLNVVQHIKEIERLDSANEPF